MRHKNPALKIFGSRIDSGEMLSITAGDMVTLAYNAHRAMEMEDIGWEDADRTFQDFWKALNMFPTAMRKTLVESCLWSCTLLDERKKLWLPYNNENYDSFLKTLLPINMQLDKKLNLIIEKESFK